jgi:hypothetical protein
MYYPGLGLEILTALYENLTAERPFLFHDCLFYFSVKVDLNKFMENGVVLVMPRVTQSLKNTETMRLSSFLIVSVF